MNKHEFAICINNRGYEVSLETRKLYEIVVDTDAEKYHQIRVMMSLVKIICIRPPYLTVSRSLHKLSSMFFKLKFKPDFFSFVWHPTVYNRFVHTAW